MRFCFANQTPGLFLGLPSFLLRLSTTPLETPLPTPFDVVIIGCGMAGLAAGIRCRLAGKSTLILERHNAPGGLNSFYSIAGRKYDVGLHAVTNYVPEGVKGAPLGKLLRQLRLSRADFALCPQLGSRVAFPGVDLRFSNDFALFESEVARAFPREMDGFRSLHREILAFPDTALEGPFVSARGRVSALIRDPLLVDMIFCPVMYYGSATEDDMDFGQFCIMFKALFCEGFARPFEGVRVIIRALVDKYRSLGGQRRMKCGVRRIVTDGKRASALELDTGEVVVAGKILSTAGLPETLRLCSDQPEDAAENDAGRLSFVETITCFNRQPKAWGWDDTIIFFCADDRFRYRRPEGLVDASSGVICLPNNYAYAPGQELPEGILRVTAMARHDQWKCLPENDYRAAKAEWYEALSRQARRFLRPVADPDYQAAVTATDMFTPTTIVKYTGHVGGAIYGSSRKVKDGRTHLENLYLAGTDQGFLGIVGAMLSGISMANLHVIQE